ncbi:MAG: hypothetical protein HC830_12545 [Bacteroidetes bacterium]|nr:hypothetical protein [Bacteroidota bacterium]
MNSTSDLTEVEYNTKLLWGERFYHLHLNSLALKQFEKAHKLKPGAYYPRYRINQLHQRLHQPKNTHIGFMVFDFNKPGILITALIFVILFSLVSMTMALIIVLFNRNKMIGQEKHFQFLREEYQTMIVNFLFSKNINEDLIKKFKEVASTKINRKILIDQMIDLSITLTGEEKERLKDLYMILKLDRDSLSKALGKNGILKQKVSGNLPL